MAEATRQPTSRKRRKAAAPQGELDYSAMSIELAVNLCHAIADDDGHAQQLRAAVDAASRMGGPEAAERLLAALRAATAALADIGGELCDARPDLKVF